MTKPNFQAMNRKDLQAYVLSYREDEAAFYAYVDKLHAEATWIEMSPLKSLEDLEKHPELRERFHPDPNPRTA
jgi:hypothetical protein